jgi:putative membrane protein
VIEGTAAASPTGRRTSPRIVAVHTVTFRQARQFVPLLIPVAATGGFGGGTTTVVLAAVAITLLSLGIAVLAWSRFTYTDTPTSVVVTRGLLFRSVRTVPNDRVRGVEVEAPLLHRVFGLVRVRIDAAAGSLMGNEEELVVDGVTRAEGDRLRGSVLAHRSAPGRPVADEDEPAPPEEPDEEVIARFDPRWLLYAPLVGSYLALPMAAVGALTRYADELPERFQPHFDGPDLSDVRTVVVVAAVALVLLALGAVAAAAVVNWGFRLTRRGSTLVAVRGLVTRRHTELEIDRIRGCTVTEGLGMRLVGAARVNALVTGLADSSDRGQLLPLGPRGPAWDLVRRLVADPGGLTAHPPAARRRRIVRAVLAGLVVALAGGVVASLSGWWWALVPGVVLTALGVPLGLARYAALGHAAGPRSFAVRGGWLIRREVLLERRAVVGWQVQQSVFQRRAGVATVVACVGAGIGGYDALDMASADVAAFTEAASAPWAGALRPAG